MLPLESRPSSSAAIPLRVSPAGTAAKPPNCRETAPEAPLGPESGSFAGGSWTVNEARPAREPPKRSGIPGAPLVESTGTWIQPREDRLETGEGAKTPCSAGLGDTVRDVFTL